MYPVLESRLLGSSAIRGLTFRVDGEKTWNVAEQSKEKRCIGKMTEKSDVIFVGNKPPMSYVLAIITAFSSGTTKDVTLKARGQAITTAVDVAEITRNRFLKD